MEFRPAGELPHGTWQFEPKWDGFRCLAARSGDAVELTSKNGQALARYFPEIVEQCLGLRAPRFIIDAEIVMRSPTATFDDLQARIHPSASRASQLAKSNPTTLKAFDLLADERGELLIDTPLRERRAALESFARRFLKTARAIELSPATTARKTAQAWLDRPHAAMDGVVAKDPDAPYRPDSRDGGFKVKRKRTADCVVGGFRYASRGVAVASLLLGLYDARGKLHHVGFTSSFSDAQRRALVKVVQPLTGPSGFTGTSPGEKSRWSTERTEAWEPLRPKLVVEVAFDRVTDARIRHGASFVRWRPDKSPRACTLDQLNSFSEEQKETSPRLRGFHRRKA